MRSRLAAAVVVTVALVGPLGVDLAAAAPAPTPTTSVTTVPALPVYRLPDTPFGDPVGGDRLAVQGRVVVDPVDVAPPVPVVPAVSFVVADLDTGEVLTAKDAHAPLPPASTIKTLTALTVLDSLELNATYPAARDDVRVEGSRVGIVAGQSYTIEQLCYGLLLSSGNDAAHALGGALGGQSQATTLMNEEARRLGAFDTHAVNTHGLDEDGQVSSAYDLALFARAGLDRDDFRKIVATERFQFPGTGSTTFEIQNQNRLLGKYRGAIGVKTGYTSNAKHTFIGAAERDGHRLVVTVMRVKGRGETAAAQLLDWGFAAIDSVQPIGRLVTPEDVAAARNPKTHPPASADSTAVGAIDAATNRIADTGSIALASPERMLPVAAGILVTATLVGIRLRRRRRGRYSASTRPV